MEVPPDEDELEEILSSSNEEDTVKETMSEDVKSENTTDEVNDDIDYSSMKVAELKELLKEKNLPVSGTKAELIKRLEA